jgi:hypothetical protein
MADPALRLPKDMVGIVEIMVAVMVVTQQVLVVLAVVVAVTMMMAMIRMMLTVMMARKKTVTTMATLLGCLLIMTDFTIASVDDRSFATEKLSHTNPG